MPMAWPNKLSGGAITADNYRRHPDHLVVSQ